MRYLLILLLFVVTNVSAQVDVHTVELDNTPVREWVRWYTDMTGESVSVDPRVSGRVSVYGAEVTDADMPEFFRAVMRSHGYRVVSSDPAVLMPDPAFAQPGESSELGYKLPGFLGEVDTPVVPMSSELIKFHYVRASDLIPVARRVLGGSGEGSFDSPSAVEVESSNSLLLTGPPEQIAVFRDLLPELDVAHPQVLIRALFYEVNEGDSLDIGFSAGSPSQASGLSGRLAGGVNTAGLGTSLATPGGSFGIYAGDMLALAFEAVQRDRNARMLSTPHVLTLSGRQGDITVGQEVPVVTGRVTGEAASIDNPFQTIERISVGLGLTVRPVVLSSGSVVLDVEASADSVSDDTFASDVVTNERRLNTTVQLAPGQTLALGGLVSDDSVESESSVPILGDLPGIGGLFRSTSVSHERRTLHVMLTADVIAAAP